MVGPEPFLRWASVSLKEVYPEARIRRPPIRIDPLRGYELLAMDPRSRLGWRIVLTCFGQSAVHGRLAEQIEAGLEIVDLLPEPYRLHHLENAKLIETYVQTGLISDLDRGRLNAELNRFQGLTVSTIARTHDGWDRGDEVEITDELELPEDGKVPTIVCSTIVGSKGLSAGRVFIVGFNDTYLPRSPTAPEPSEVYQLIVALSRTRKECHLVTMPGERSTFLSWIRQPIVERIAR